MSTLLIVALPIFEWNPTSDPVWPVFGNSDRRLTFLVNVIAALDAAYGIAECAGLLASSRAQYV